MTGEKKNMTRGGKTHDMGRKEKKEHLTGGGGKRKRKHTPT